MKVRAAFICLGIGIPQTTVDLGKAFTVVNHIALWNKEWNVPLKQCKSSSEEGTKPYKRGENQDEIK